MDEALLLDEIDARLNAIDNLLEQLVATSWTRRTINRFARDAEKLAHERTEAILLPALGLQDARMLTHRARLLREAAKLSKSFAHLRRPPVSYGL